MPVLRTTCSTCKELFKSADDVYGTSCGHLFHTACLQEWKRRGTSCPQCFNYNPTSYKIYLSLDEVENVKAEEIKAKLKSRQEQITHISLHINKTENKILQLHKKLASIEKSKRGLEERIEHLNESKHNFLQLQEQFTESSELVKSLQERLKQLDIENESQLKELQLKCVENETLTTSLEADESHLSDDIVNVKVKFLENRLKHIAEEWEKEIVIGTKLSIANIKLTNYANQLNSKEKIVKPSLKESGKKQFQKEHTEKPSQKANRDKNKNQTNDSNSNSVFIRGLLLHQIDNPLENVIVSIAAKMQLFITKDDLITVNFVHDKDWTCLKAQFKSRKLKDKFLSRRSILKDSPLTKSIDISELMNEQLYSLFKYAEDNLKSCGYHAIFSRSNNIYAKMHRNVGNAVLIKNRAQVDMMKSMKL